MNAPSRSGGLFNSFSVGHCMIADLSMPWHAVSSVSSTASIGVLTQCTWKPREYIPLFQCQENTVFDMDS